MTNFEDLPRTRKEAINIGSKFYFTGKPCKRGHVSQRLVSSGCLSCHNIKYKKWRMENPELNKEIGRRNYQKNIVKQRNKSRLYMSIFRKKHPEINKERYKKFKEKVGKEYFKPYLRNSRAKRKLATGKHTAIQINNLMLIQRKSCANCKSSLKKKYHADHITPIARGGSNDIKNIQLLCPTCNLKKSKKDPIIWAQENGRLL